MYAASAVRTLWRCYRSFEKCRPGWPAAVPGPLCGGELGTTGPQGSRHGCRLLFARTGVRSKSPAPTHELAGHACPASAKWGVVFSWVLLFWTSKREVPRPPKEDESFCSEIEMVEMVEQKHRAQNAPLQFRLSYRSLGAAQVPAFLANMCLESITDTVQFGSWQLFPQPRYPKLAALFDRDWTRVDAAAGI
jgi:hypothetical protein